MLPPVLEIYVVWHPGDAGGSLLAEQIAGHFQGSPYAELMAETVQVYLRSVPWDGPGSMPRPIPWPDQVAASSVRPAAHVAVVPLIGLELCRALQRGDAGWQAYLGDIVAAEHARPQRVSVQPIRLDGAVTPAIEALFGRRQLVGEPDSLLSNDGEAIDQTRLRELVQALAQWLTGTRLKVFVSHTKRRGTVTGSNPATTETEAVEPLVRSVLDVLRSSRFEKFYDANDLQPHENWDTALTTQAAQCALLALRTDLYATRDWCQREVMLAKTHGRPVVVLDAQTAGEARGSFLLDHVPRLPVRRAPDGGRWSSADIRRGVQGLADAWLCRVLWLRQRDGARGVAPYDDYTWLPQAPELLTLLDWMSPAPESTQPDAGVVFRPHGLGPRLLHPDPPMTPTELGVLRRLAGTRLGGTIDIVTPRQLAAQGH